MSQFFKAPQNTKDLAKEDSKKQETQSSSTSTQKSSTGASGTLLSTGNTPAATKPPVSLPSGGGAIRMGESPTKTANPRPFENQNTPDPNAIPEAPVIDESYSEDMPFDPNYPTDFSEDAINGAPGAYGEDGSSAMNPYPNDQPGGFNGATPSNKNARPLKPPPLDPMMQGMPPMHGGGH
jgi:hypothetical protein